MLIKCGTKGMYLQTADADKMQTVGSRLNLDASIWADRKILQSCFTADYVRSGTGAGDTSIAAFLTAVLQGKTPDVCTAHAAAEGVYAVASYDALGGLKSLKQLEEKISAGWKTM